MPIEQQIPVVLAFVIGGLIWSTGGYFSNWRNHLSFVKQNPAGTVDPNWKGFEIPKLKDDVILGLILGIAGFFVSAYQGATISITDLHSFGSAIVVAFGIIGITDKYVVSGIFNK